MKLSDLVALRNNLVRYLDWSNVRNEARIVEQNIDSLKHSFPDYSDDIRSVTETINDVETIIRNSYEQLNSTVTKINNQIEQTAQQYFNKDYKFHYVVDILSSIERDKWLIVTPEIKEVILGRIRLYSNWHYPGMELGPRRGEYTPYLVGCDPLYLVDIFHETLDEVPKLFPVEYQSRLRTYNIGHWQNEKGFKELPQNQFGFVFSWNYFNYLTLDEIKKYLVDIFGVLRAGGTVMFSYNNGELLNGAKHAEFGGMTFTPKQLLIAICEGHGFEIVNSFDYETDWQSISWLEIKKPGILVTTKAHQTLGSVKDIPE